MGTFREASSLDTEPKYKNIAAGRPTTRHQGTFVTMQHKRVHCLFAAFVLASLATVCAQSPCDCQEGEDCQWKKGAYLCYTRGGLKCPKGTPSNSRPGQTWIFCPPGGARASQAAPTPAPAPTPTPAPAPAPTQVAGPCDCSDEGCVWQNGVHLCYTKGGPACSASTPSDSRPGYTLIYCPAGQAAG